MKAVILCGGLGTRLREETEFRPKPMVEIGGRPILWHIMKLYSHYGINDFVLCLGYKGEVIKDYFLNYEALNNDFTITLGKRDEIEFHDAHTEDGWKVTLAETGEDAMTARRLLKIRRYVEHDESFCVTYGDGVADVNVGELLDFHAGHGRTATVTSVQIPSRFGVMSVSDDDGHVSAFTEKAHVEGWVNGGFLVFRNDVFDYLRDDVMLEQGPLETMAKDNCLMAFRHHGFWQSMDTYRETTMLNKIWYSGTAPWKVWGAEHKSAD